MRVRIISLGTNWWSAHPRDVTDPFCFRRNAAWFNSAGLRYGNRLRLCWVYPGQIRFNQASGFHPEFPNRILGCSFECNEPNRVAGQTHLLITRALGREEPTDHSLVTFTERLCGSIRFSRPGWKSAGVQLISASLRRDRFEVIALMRASDWIESTAGRWMISDDRSRFVLADDIFGDKS